MPLSNELLEQFVKATKVTEPDKKESTVFGTIVEVGDEGDNVVYYVHLDGAAENQLTPIEKTSDVAKGDRVTVLIKNHTAIITGNMTSPSARGATVQDLGVVVADKVDTNTLKAQIARIDSLEVNKADVSVLNAEIARIDNLEVDYGNITDLTTQNLTAVKADIEDLKVNKLDVVDADIIKADITDLNAEVANIDTLIFGSATGDTIQTSFSNAVIAQLGDAQIKSAMIESVTASKIIAGDINTNKVRVKSEDGSLLISDETMQISDDTRVRVQIGKDASGDYSINIWDAEGNLMFSRGGITDSAIKDAIIRNDMVSDTANIAAHKLNIDSLFEEINGSSNTIKSTQIYLDDEDQTLNVAFKELETEVTDLGTTVSSQGTQITAVQGQISSKVWQQDITTAIDGMTIGGRNLLRETSTPYDSGYFLRKQYDGSHTTSESTYGTAQAITFDVTEASSSWCYHQYWLSDAVLSLIKPSTVYTLSFDVKSNAALAFKVSLTKSDSSSSISGHSDTVNITTDEWNHVVLAFTTTDFTSTDSQTLYFHGNNVVQTTTYANFKLEEGMKATAWSPAPEDITDQTNTLSTQYSALEQTVDGISTTVARHTSEIANKADGSAVTTVSSKVSELEQTIEGFQTTVSETYATKTEVDSIELGGRNLLLDTGTHKTIVGQNKSNQTSTVYWFTDVLLNDWSNRTVTLSFDYEIICDGEIEENSERVWWAQTSPNFWYQFGHGTTTSRLTYTGSTKGHFEGYTIFPSSDEYSPANSIQIRLDYMPMNTSVTISNMKLEYGKLASTWTCAPEDTESRISTAESSITQNATSIATNVSEISSLGTRMTTVEQTASGLTVQLKNTKKQLYHSAEGTRGNSGYVGICTIKVADSYMNRPIIFELNNRGKQSSNVSFCFTSINGTDPGLYHLQYDGGIDVWAYKSDTSTWSLIVQKSEGYDTIYVKDFANNNEGVTVTWTNTHYDSLPTSNITAGTLLAGKITKATIDDAAKTATNFLSYDSTSGLQVGNKSNGSWVGFRTQITNAAFNILSAAGTTLASYGEKVIELGKNATDAVIKFCGGKGQIEYIEDYLQLSADSVRLKGKEVASLYSNYTDGNGVFRNGAVHAAPGEVNVVAGGDGSNSSINVKPTSIQMTTNNFYLSGAMNDSKNGGTYVSVTTGTSGIWTYKKFSDGYLEMWGSYAISNMECTNAMGGMYRTAVFSPTAFPFTVYNPNVVASYESEGYGAFLWATTNTTTAKPPNYYLVRPTSTTIANGKIIFHVCGRWKT